MVVSGYSFSVVAILSSVGNSFESINSSSFVSGASTLLILVTSMVFTIPSVRAGEPALKDDTPPDALIGYTEFRTDLPGGRYVNVVTMRAAVVKADGTGRRVLAEELTREKNYWTQFNGWSPDGKIAIFSRAWESDENLRGRSGRTFPSLPRVTPLSSSDTKVKAMLSVP